MVAPSGMANSRPDLASATTKPPAGGASSGALKYSTWTRSGGRLAAAASNASIIGVGPQQ